MSHLSQDTELLYTVNPSSHHRTITRPSTTHKPHPHITSNSQMNVDPSQRIIDIPSQKLNLNKHRNTQIVPLIFTKITLHACKMTRQSSFRNARICPFVVIQRKRPNRFHHQGTVTTSDVKLLDGALSKMICAFIRNVHDLAEKEDHSSKVYRTEILSFALYMAATGDITPP